MAAVIGREFPLRLLSAVWRGSGSLEDQLRELTRLEFVVIGSTVNVASRLEALTRALGCALVASDDLVSARRPSSAMRMGYFGR